MEHMCAAMHAYTCNNLIHFFIVRVLRTNGGQQWSARVAHLPRQSTTDAKTLDKGQIANKFWFCSLRSVRLRRISPGIGWRRRRISCRFTRLAGTSDEKEHDHEQSACHV
jgi:hypothetical protein